MSVCTNVTDGQTSFSYFSLVSVQSHSQEVCPSVRRSGAKKKRDGQTQTDKHTDPIGGNTLNVTDGTIQEQTCRTITLLSQYAMHACNAMQYM
jgi:hypothetical protein